MCPAGLCVKWQEEMHDRFGLEFRIVNTDAVRQLRRDRGVGANVFTSFPRLIVSIDWLNELRAQSLLDEILTGVDHRRTPRAFDLLIVDEVHSIAPPGHGRPPGRKARRSPSRSRPRCWPNRPPPGPPSTSSSPDPTRRSPRFASPPRSSDSSSPAQRARDDRQLRRVPDRRGHRRPRRCARPRRGRTTSSSIRRTPRRRRGATPTPSIASTSGRSTTASHPTPSSMPRRSSSTDATCCSRAPT